MPANSVGTMHGKVPESCTTCEVSNIQSLQTPSDGVFARLSLISREHRPQLTTLWADCGHNRFPHNLQIILLPPNKNHPMLLLLQTNMTNKIHQVILW